jgi:hypothetical protein
MMLVACYGVQVQHWMDGRGGESSKYKSRTEPEQGAHIKVVFGWQQIGDKQDAD